MGERIETEFFDVIMSRLEDDRVLFARADSMLRAICISEPLIEDACETPQDIRYHAEGPFVRDHLRLMLIVLYAVVEGKFHLREIEELHRLKGYEQEVDELETRLKDHAAWFEAFIFCHDAAKWAALLLRAPEQSRGAQLGFNVPLTYEPDVDIANRGEMRGRYLALYRQFVAMHPNESPQEVQATFYRTYEIEVKYPYHDRMIHTPVYHALLQRFILAHKLTDIDGAML